MAPGGETAVGYDDSLVVGGGDDGREHLDFLDRSGKSLSLDVVTHLERFEGEDKHSAGKVLKRAAQCHAYSDTGRGEEREKRAGLYAEDADDSHDEYKVEHYPHKTQHKRQQRGFDIASAQQTVGEVVETVDDKLTGIKHQYCSRERNGEVGQVGGDCVDNLVKRHVFKL